MKLSARQIGEFEARAFLGEDTWKSWKADYDTCMGFRKTLKGKPTEEQRIELVMNAVFIEFYGSVLFHSTVLARRFQCGCTKCGQDKQHTTTQSK